MYDFFYNDFSFFILRFAVGVVIISYGLPKIRQADSLYGKKYKNVSILHGIVEILGGILLISGLWIRAVSVILATSIFGIMYVRVLMRKDPFRAGWAVTFLLFIALIMFALTGGGNWRIIL